MCFNTWKNYLKFLLFTFIYCVFVGGSWTTVCTWKWGQPWWAGLPYLPCEYQGLNSDYKIWWEKLLPDSSTHENFLLFTTFSHCSLPFESKLLSNPIFGFRKRLSAAYLKHWCFSILNCILRFPSFILVSFYPVKFLNFLLTFFYHF